MGRKSVFSRIKAVVAAAAMTVTVLTSGYVITENSTADAVGIDANFAKALQYSMQFYDANMCGGKVSENSTFAWRGDCHCQDEKLDLDGTYTFSNNTYPMTNMSSSFISQNKSVLDPDGDGYVDVSGGFHDAGDHPKFGLPQAYSASTLAWGYYEFRDSYVKTGQDKHMETILKYFNEYFMKCTFRDSKGDVVAFCYQVGNGDVDHADWSAPELQTEMPRPARFATAEDPATDCVTNTAAALAASYMDFKDTDSAYANKCLDYAKALYAFAMKNSKAVSDDGSNGLYYTSKKWQDDLCWGAIWLYIATGNNSYMTDVNTYIDKYAAPSWVHCWNDVWGGVICLLAEQTNDSFYWDQVNKTVQNWMNNYNTPGGYAFLNEWGSARYNTAGQLTALVYAKHKNNQTYAEWAKGQMEYLMGDNPANTCYIVGYNEYSVKHPHHRASSGIAEATDTSDHKHVLYGALVGGPDGSDNYTDVTEKYVYTEVTIDYNAAFVGACAGLYEFFGDSTQKVEENFPPAEQGANSERFWVEGFVSDDANVTAVTLYVYANLVPPRAVSNVSVRYYFGAAGITDLSSMVVQKYYDQTGGKANISGPYKYNDDTYYIEVSWGDYAIANANEKYQFAVGSYNTANKWDASDDFSHKELTTGTTAELAPYICVYVDGKLVGGTDPDGNVGGGSTEEVTYDVLAVKNYILNTGKVTSADGLDYNSDGKVNSLDVAYAKYKLIG